MEKLLRELWSEMIPFKLIILGLVVYFFSNSLYAQALVKGDIDIHAGLGFGVYSISSNDPNDSKSAGVPGLLSVGVGYQLNDPFSIGLNYERNGFATESDSNNKAVSNNIGLIFAYNFLNKEKNVLNVSLEFGYSYFRYDDLSANDHVIGKGPQFQLGGAWKHYFGKHIGMYLNLSIPYIYYSSLEYEDGNELKINYTDANGNLIRQETYTIDMSGANFRIGLLLKL